MARWLDRIIALAGLAALVACVEVAPRSSVPFQTAQDRHARYLAEIALAIKEDRRDAASEAAANGRLVRPQMPEIWGVAQPPAPGAPTALALGPPPADPHRPSLHAPWRSACAPPADGCAADLRLAGLAPGLLLDAAIVPAAAPLEAAGASASPNSFEVYFAPGSAALDAAAEHVLERAAGRALMARPVRVVVAAHADRSGEDASNQRLAQRRAAAVAHALIGAGVPAERIETTALGERAPAVPTEDGVPHCRNRRVDITLL